MKEKSETSLRWDMVAVGLLLVSHAVVVQAAGLSTVTTSLNAFKTSLMVVVPIIAALALALLGLGYAIGFVDKHALYKWGIGLIIAGAASEITALVIS